MAIGLAAIGLFFLGWFIGKQIGENAGYQKGWTDKENGSPYKLPH